MLKLETDSLILRDMSLEDECTFVAMSQVQSVSVSMMKVIANLANIES